MPGSMVPCRLVDFPTQENSQVNPADPGNDRRIEAACSANYELGGDFPFRAVREARSVTTPEPVVPSISDGSTVASFK